MRLASCFVISLALHSVALIQPISFYPWKREPPIVVTILPIEMDGREGSGSAGNRNGTQGIPRGTFSKTVAPSGPVAIAQEVSESFPSRSPVEVTAKTSDSNIVLSASTKFSEAAFTAGVLGLAGNGSGPNGSGTASTGAGIGGGQEIAQSAALFTQARYRETPKPAYPDGARREGREGRVLLRVLIDDLGKTKSIEINRSSGSDALDQAATEAIKLWRFHPARASDKPVESWVSIPIEFQLKDSRN